MNTVAPTAEAFPDCDTQGAIQEMKQSVLNRQWSDQNVLAQRDGGLPVLVFARNAQGEADLTKSAMVSPAIAACGKRVVRYLAVTADRNKALGTTYPIKGTHLFVASKSPKGTVAHSLPVGGSLTQPNEVATTVVTRKIKFSGKRQAYGFPFAGFSDGGVNYYAGELSPLF